MINSVYIHIPFCQNICPYCGFCKQYYNKDRAKKYLEALDQEIKTKYKGDIIKTLYIGGGTPSVLSKELLTRLFVIIKQFNLDDNCEFTMEVNPESIDVYKLKLMLKSKVNRISIGVESCNDKVLSYLGRDYTYQDVVSKIDLIKQVGFKNINVDLMYAINNETLKDLTNDLDKILKLDVNHISTYSLMIEPNTMFHIKNVKPISEDLDYEMYQKICYVLKEHDYNHYEISNFAKDGYESKHNLVYWHNEKYYGFGLGASGYIENVRYTNTCSMHDYLNGNYVKEKEAITIEEDISYELILGFRLIKGINKKQFRDKFKCDILDVYNVKELIKKKDLIDNGTNIWINYDKIYVENSILVNFVGEV